ncbi:hypothetical protein [Nocardioides sp. B-3]|uniref:hypothetical protein n=1 Tax=Nocardioides sp. B-3 TaxID=2895565 RepID=UPI0021536B4F|nr:hypothetical protein [Nocardioides sp. B-3]UUZ60364.1 hypothetical protein LP418_05500 [Nocardioides sp. B-3]
MPRRVDIHERLLVDRLGARPPRGARPAKLEALAAEVRAAFGAPGLNPRLASRAVGRASAVPDLRSLTPERARCARWTTRASSRS